MQKGTDKNTKSENIEAFNILPKFFNKFNWQIIIIGFSLVALFLSFLFYVLSVLDPNLPLLIGIIIGGIPCILEIIVKLIKGDLGADLLAALALITAVVLNQYLAGIIIILMLSGGQALEAFAMRKASSVLLALAERMPTVVHKKVKNDIQDILLKDVCVGDKIVIYPHETCPVDGVVLEGKSSMDESYLTGEPYQISKIPGTEVISGSINGESALTIQALKLPMESRYAAIIGVLEDAEHKKPKIRRLGDQIGAIFAPLALLLALGAWYFTNDAMRFLSVLVIATPCPLLIAIPITVISAISMAARHSIIIKDPTVLERLPMCRTAIFDKTGTLTYGKPTLTEIITQKDFNSDFILQNAASLERYSKHPLSLAILQAAEKNKLPLLNVTSVKEAQGKGLVGIIGQKEIHITNRKKLLEKHPGLSEQLPPTVTGLECMILIDNQYAATFRFHDMPRIETKSFIGHLKPCHKFDKIMLVSGDRESEVKYLGDFLKITDIYASQTPEQKLEIVRSETKKSPTLYMGDGINDAPALTAATVGIAFGQFSNITAEASGAVIMDNYLNKVDELIHLSSLTYRIALQSAIGGMILSLIGMGFAAGGYITPVVGAILQEVIDILAILNALRLIWTNQKDIAHNFY